MRDTSTSVSTVIHYNIERLMYEGSLQQWFVQPKSETNNIVSAAQLLAQFRVQWPTTHFRIVKVITTTEVIEWP